MAWHRTVLLFLICVLSFGCSKKPYDNALPDSSELGSARGYRVARVITHFHSPYSYDACDRNGTPGGVVNQPCLDHLKAAFCQNRVDFAFITDHPANQAQYEMSDLLLPGPHDTLLYKAGLPYANQVSGCPNGFVPTLTVGFESRLMSLGMEQHILTDPAARADLYGHEDLDLRNRLDTVSHALVVIPHTESRTTALISSLHPDAIEIYNIHANLDPKIRKTDLGVPPFELIPNILTYLLDPYSDLVPDFMFVGFFANYPIYAQRWNELIATGVRVTGLGGTDSHENIFPQGASDGERLDSHRRMTRFMSNHFLVNSMDVDSVKAAIKAGRGWVVYEGFGSPVGMDFYATISGTTVGVGDAHSLAGGSATITVKLPSLHARTPQGDEKPMVRILLKHVLTGGQDEVVASATNADLVFATTQSGAYRAEVTITPRHLKEWLGSFSDEGDSSFPWITTNHLYLDP